MKCNLLNYEYRDTSSPIFLRGFVNQFLMPSFIILGGKKLSWYLFKCVSRINSALSTSLLQKGVQGQYLLDKFEMPNTLL